MNQRRKILLFLVLAGLVLPQQAFGLEIRYPTVPGADPPQVFTEERPADEHFPLFLKYIYHVILTLSGLACFYAIATGAAGYFFYNWQGAPAKTRNAIDKTSMGVTGLLIVVTSYLMISTINPDILRFQVGKPEVEIQEQRIMRRAEHKADYVEIPTGPLIEQVVERSKLVKEQTGEVEAVSQAVRDTAFCIKMLTEQCTCSILELNCECIDPPECTSCQEASCEGDPCNLMGQGCRGGEVNIRQALERERARLAAYTDLLEREKENLKTLQENLDRANTRLKYAEALIRDRAPGSEVYSYTNFIAVKQRREDEGARIKIDQVWRFEEAVPQQELPSHQPMSGPTKFECSDNCRASHIEDEDLTPCCWNCEEKLVCFGNDFKCDQNNVDAGLCSNLCGSNEIFPDSDPGDNESRSFPASDPRIGDLIQYNGKMFAVPSGGVHFCDMNEPGCLYPTCEGYTGED